ncbi:hypothetical protein [Stutzerimonas nitrititolerans]|uniref:hypothetical protein n=1 Tax=Stutzerimonas nitrititolerans TaxID=2482751 RepID=UPI0028AAEA3C|nr:hypothetical protein [Stutzerimonas nitrititolerans]
MDARYWIVGAMFGGCRDQLDTFIKRGYWYCWDPHKARDNEIPEQTIALFKQIQRGDRLAVKKMLGRGSPSMEVRALGIVTDIDQDEWRIYVDWLVPNMSRLVPIRGCMGSIHGPFDGADRADVFII